MSRSLSSDQNYLAALELAFKTSVLSVKDDQAACSLDRQEGTRLAPPPPPSAEKAQIHQAAQKQGNATNHKDVKTMTLNPSHSLDSTKSKARPDQPKSGSTSGDGDDRLCCPFCKAKHEDT